MKLKKILSLIGVGIFAGTLFTGCGENGKVNPPEEVKIGMITTLNASEQKVSDILKKVEEKSNVKISPHRITFYNNLSNMQMGLESGSVDEISTYECVANYLTAKNPKITILDNHYMPLSDSFCFAVRKGDTMLKNDLNKAIKEMENDGTLVNLSKKYIVELKNGAEPPAVEIPMIDGADTIKVAVTGDLPPFDMILADGTPAGYSTAVLAEVSKRINKNIELVSVDSSARATILTSKGADVVFWVAVPKDSNLLPANIDIPAEIDVSNSYYSDNIVHIGKK